MKRHEANERFDELFEAIEEVAPSCDPEHVRAHVYRLLHRLGSSGTIASDGVGDSSAKLAQRAREIMQMHVQASLTIEQVAAACRTSSSALKQAFKLTYGMPIGQWYRAYRIDQAQRLLLETDLSIALVAASVGYANPSKFAKAFRSQTGESPKAWRASHQ